MKYKIKKLIWEIRMALFIWCLNLILNLVPKKSIKTWNWVLQLPFEEYKNDI